jgi:hypothetical protein
METQLVRLDAPYNLICNKEGDFGLHIATLMVIREHGKREVPEVRCYPVVAEKYELGGNAWMDHELFGCQVVAQPEGSITLRTIKQVMQTLSSPKESVDMAVIRLMTALKMYKVSITLSSEERGENTVELCFSGSPETSSVAFSAESSNLYFYAFFDNYVINKKAAKDFSQAKAVDDILKARQAYMLTLQRVDSGIGVTDITFYTNQPEYKYFVDELNKKAHANG